MRLCGSPNLTWEHVFSKWTHRYLPPRKRGNASSSVGLLYVDRPEETTAIKLRGQLRDWQVKCVCGGPRTSCNNGWMKDIEDRARPIMTDLLVGNDRRLFPKDHEVIATWAILKVMVAEFDVKANVTVHHTQRQYIMRHQHAPTHGWSVWIGHYERKDWIAEWVSRPMLLVTEAVADRRSSYDATYFNSNATTQVIGKSFYSRHTFAHG